MTRALNVLAAYAPILNFGIVCSVFVFLVSGANQANARAATPARHHASNTSKPAAKEIKPATLFTSEQIVEAVKRANIVSNGYPIDASVNGSEIVVSTYRRPQAFDNDCKIDAVLIAKQVVDLDAKAIEKVSVVFQDAKHSNRYHKVIVTAADVRAFGAGHINQDKFLESLVIVSGTETNALVQYKDLSYQDILDGKASCGILSREREQAFARIRELEKRGLAQQSVSEDLEIYLRIEDLCRRQNQFEAKIKLDELNRVLAQQEQVTGLKAKQNRM